MNKKNIIIIFILINIVLTNQKIIIPMDESQSNHLKAYGIAYSSLKNGYKVEWLLNYRGGSFLLNISEKIKRNCNLKGVSYQELNIEEISMIFSTIEEYVIFIIYPL